MSGPFQQHQEEDKSEYERSPSWLISMGDVTALMLTFFVMLFSMSHIQSEKWDAVISLINTRLDPSEIRTPQPTSELNTETVTVLSGLSTEYLGRILRDKLDTDPVLANAQLSELQEQIVISLPGDVFFQPGSDQLKPGIDQSVLVMAGILSQFGNQIEIVGHADPSVAPGDGFASVWSLSLGRALAFAEQLTEKGYGGDFVVLGMGDGQFRFLDQAVPEEERFVFSRRIDVVVRADAGGQ